MLSRRSRRKTGPTESVVLAVWERAGYSCERCTYGAVRIGEPPHHRRPRKMGGTNRPDVNAATNLALLCHACHAEVESNREQAKLDGWLVADWEAPETVPMSDLYGHRFIFDDDRRVDLT
jgi:5-methylcytosine-specific restriction enzyme A